MYVLWLSIIISIGMEGLYIACRTSSYIIYYGNIVFQHIVHHQCACERAENATNQPKAIASTLGFLSSCSMAMIGNAYSITPAPFNRYGGPVQSLGNSLLYAIMISQQIMHHQYAGKRSEKA